MRRVRRLWCVRRLRQMNGTVKQAWITLNRQCNLRCRWCYAQGTAYEKDDDLPLERADQIIRLLSDLAPDRVSLLGGEPTCYPHLERILRQLREHGLKPVLITNGLALADRGYVDKLVSAGLCGVDISMKGWSRESYGQNTGVRGYEKVLSAVQNVSESPLESVVSFVVSSENVEQFFPAVADARRRGADCFYFSFENDFSPLDTGRRPEGDFRRIFHVAEEFTARYEALNAVTGGRFQLHQSYPACIWDSAFLQTLADRGQLSTSCQLLEHAGVVFDTDGSVIPCNCMYQLKIGKIGVDFLKRDEFLSFWNSERVEDIFRKLRAVPSAACAACGDWNRCKGGCIANWFACTHSELLEAHRRYLESRRRAGGTPAG
ncbi:MAG: radical SAM protein [Oscillospiraceae bacterium]|nr:radical SAM protein [Oscillospiraceae bacterium]